MVSVEVGPLAEIAELHLDRGLLSPLPGAVFSGPLLATGAGKPDWLCCH